MSLVVVLASSPLCIWASHLGLLIGRWGFEILLKKDLERLAFWKRQYISKGGRLTLIRSMLSSLPIYFLSLFRMPKLVCSRLEKIQIDFLWGGGNLERKPHLVNWKTVCSKKNKRGFRGQKPFLVELGFAL